MGELSTVSLVASGFGVAALLACVITFPSLINELSNMDAEIATVAMEYKTKSSMLWDELRNLRQPGYVGLSKVKRQVNDVKCQDGQDPATDSSGQLIRCAQSSCPSGYRCTFSEIPYFQLCCPPAKATGDQCQCNPNNNCPEGPRGPPGVRGNPGKNGDPGDRGDPGDDAGDFTTSINVQCPPCQPGPPGNPGPPGPAGPSGPRGERGPPGFNNRSGPPGPPGNPGNPGNRGRPGPGGPKGPPGEPGNRGLRGNPGPPGGPGGPGNRGGPGRRGNNGPPGPPGPPGPRGVNPGREPSGPSGPPGPRGQDGQPGNDAQYCPCPQKSGVVVGHRSLFNTRN